MDVYGDLLTQHIPYKQAYEFCSEAVTLFGTVIMGMLGSIIYMRKQDAKRAERANELLVALIDKVEARTRAENG